MNCHGHHHNNVDNGNNIERRGKRGKKDWVRENCAFNILGRFYDRTNQKSGRKEEPLCNKMKYGRELTHYTNSAFPSARKGRESEQKNDRVRERHRQTDSYGINKIRME